MPAERLTAWLVRAEQRETALLEAVAGLRAEMVDLRAEVARAWLAQTPAVPGAAPALLEELHALREDVGELRAREPKGAEVLEELHTLRDAVADDAATGEAVRAELWPLMSTVARLEARNEELEAELRNLRAALESGPRPRRSLLDWLLGRQGGR